jgi:hypothetical protein
MFSQGNRTPRKLGLLGLLGLALLLAVSCGPSDKARGQVKGKVTVGDGKPVKAGTVIFWGTGNRQGSSLINHDGTYVMGDAPVGEVKITVVPGTPPPAAPKTTAPAKKGEKPEKPEKPVVVPEKYKDVAKTPLTYTVTLGDQEYDIKLESDAVGDTAKHGKK